MTKVGYVGVYRDGTGWGHAAVDYILALDSVGVDVVPRPLKLNEARPDLPARIRELESKSTEGCDLVIQHVLPHQMDFQGEVKNVALFATETDSFASSSWPRRINLMDQAWVINKQMVGACKRSGVVLPISVIPHTCDVSKYERAHDQLDLPGVKDNFIFYFVGEHNRRKNLFALVRAFHLEFGRNEPVQLVLKINGTTPEQINQELDEIKKGMKLYADPQYYKREIVITEYLPEDMMLRLHQTCDCIVSPSYGEAWGIPTFDAMAMGSAVIASRFGGFEEYLSNECAWLVDGRMEPCFGMMDTFHDLYTANENWFSIEIEGLRRAMREAYEDRELLVKKTDAGRERAYDFSYDKVGRLMKQKIEEILQ